jgi:hypothetical protein
MSTEFHIQVTKIDINKVSHERIMGALQMAGQAYQSAVRDYPEPPANATYERTENLAKQARWKVDGTPGGPYRCDLIAPFYYKFLLFGTGIYGPNASPITGNMAWQVTNGGNPLAGTWIHAHTVKGTIWPGKLDVMKQAVKDGFMVGLRRQA